MFICVCNAITERQVQAAVADGASSMADLQGQLGVASCCGCCADTAAEYLPGGRYAGQVTVHHGVSAVAAAAANDPVVVQVDFTEIAFRRACTA
ncbi:(2Fe-2S)-binding protein [Parapusillimonas granuli]|uniref:Bacterioferritin-associated ferredoxin n=1 Tax=Parapusillimonas granuli TaxID=380911 RepID=A0A853FQW8_9BURK|nr:(2Fe-2S)-binding protein [Parapusillimonas granuli]NYT48214.1 (2Fe-2S)-binding protein [Parapusillimonas granuli]